MTVNARPTGSGCAESFDNDLLDHAPQSVVLLDSSGHVIGWNKASEQLYGWDRNDMVGEHLGERLSCRLTGVRAPGFRRDGIPDDWSGWLRREARDGSPRFVHVIRRKMRGSDGDRTRVVEFVTDQAGHLDGTHAARVAVLGQLTASIAHEVSQPLSTIALTSASMLSWLARDAPNLDELRELAKSTAEQATRAAEVLGRIRTMASRAETSMHPVAINAIVQDSFRFLHHEFLLRDIDVEAGLDPTDPVVFGDGVQLQQVLVNLALNAVQAMTGASCDVRRLRVSTRAPVDGWIALWVEDTGPGIAAADAHTLFQSFHTTKPDGMGLGLPISQSIVQGHGGMIRLAERREGWGARFVVELPVFNDPG